MLLFNIFSIDNDGIILRTGNEFFLNNANVHFSCLPPFVH